NVSISETYSNGQVSWSGNGTSNLYLDEDGLVPYQGQLADDVYFIADDAGNYTLKTELFITGCTQPVNNTVHITVNDVDAPAGDAEQSFLAGAKVSDLDVQGNNLKYYIKENGDYVRQSINAKLLNNETYYITQSQGDCVSD